MLCLSRAQHKAAVPVRDTAHDQYRTSLQDVLAMAMTYLQEALCADAFRAALCPVERWIEEEANGALLQLQAGERQY